MLSDQYTELILDGLLIQNHLFSQKKRTVLAVYGRKNTGKLELVDYLLPSHENEKDWELFLTRLRNDGLKGQNLKKITSDGDHNLSNVIAQVYPSIPQEIDKNLKFNTFSLFLKIYFSFDNPKKLRLLSSWILGLLYLGLAKISASSFYFGLPFIIIGEMIRIWAAGSIVKTKELTISGPYAYTRNPLYLGSFLTILGFGILGQTLWLSLIGSFLFYIIYKRTILKEEESLTERFGKPFEDYLCKVPRFFPRVIFNCHSEEAKRPKNPDLTGSFASLRYAQDDNVFGQSKSLESFSFTRCYHNGEPITATGILLITLLIHLKTTPNIFISSLVLCGTSLLLLFQYLERTNK